MKQQFVNRYRRARRAAADILLYILCLIAFCCLALAYYVHLLRVTRR